MVLAVGCHKEAATPAPAGPVSTAEQDALWKLAPAGALGGIVISPHGLQMVEHAWIDLDTMVHASPELAEFAKNMDAQLQRSTGQTKPSFAALGISTTKGGAVFITADKKPVTIIPVADRDVFLKLVHGTKGDKTDKLDEHTTCQTLNGNYVCVEDVAMFDQLGKGQLSIAPAGARGDIELVGNVPLGKQPVTFAGAVQLARGAVTVRGEVTGVPKAALAAMGEASKPRLDGDKTTGFGLAHLKSVFAALPMPDKAQLMFATVGDPVTLVTYSNKLDAQLPLLDTGPASMLVNACGDGPLGKVGAKAANGVCSFPVPNMPAMNVALSIDGKTLHAGMTTQGATSNTVELTSFGKELADGSWQDAFWGHGTLLASDQNMAAQLGQMPVPMDPTLINTAIRAMTMLNEFGIAARVDGDALRFVVGLRTAWSNPDGVVAKLLAIAPSDVLAGKGAGLAASIATKGSPLENDLKAGYTGMMVPMSGVGVMAAVAIPAFIQYMKRSKESEASLELNKIGKAAKRSFVETGSYPVGDAALLPAKACCGQPQNKCAPEAAAFAADPVWSKLEFSIDEPTIYQYRYHSDGKTLVVEAIGDADCDGAMATFKLEGGLTADGNPMMNIIPPPSGVY
jgi:type IV pilus assembly protein PilA